MSKVRMAAMIGGTVICALGIGFVMQSLDQSSSGGPAAQNVPIQKSILPPAPVAPAQKSPKPVDEDQAALDLERITLTAAAPDIPKPRPAPLPVAPSDPDLSVLGCAVSAQAVPGLMAHVTLNVTAPCFINERVTVHHNGMIFTEVTDQDGVLEVSVPALAQRAVFIVAFANGKGAVATAHVPELAQFDRVAVQWSGDSGFQIHAREFGASYGEAGHVWSGSTDSVVDGGRVTRLGEVGTFAPQLVEVYTFPTGFTDHAGTIALSVEAEVTDVNCGRDVAAQSLELRGAASLRTRDLILSVPNCGAIGDFLVLNNLVDDLKIASN